MRLKECDPRVPKDSRFIHNKENLIVGIETTDGSFDYTTKGQEFLGLDVNKKTSDPKLSSLC